MGDGAFPYPTKTIPELPVAAPLTGSEQVWINQGGIDVQVALSDVISELEPSPVVPYDFVPVMDGVGNPGMSDAYSRGDHVHPSDTTKLGFAGGTMTGALILAAGSSAPTVTPATDDSNAVATTAFVQGAIVAGALLPSTNPPVMDGVASPGGLGLYSRGDHVHPSDTSRAPLASPALLGAPTAPTPPATDSSTRLATTAFVTASFLPISAAASIYLTISNAASTYAPLVNAALLGAPTAPTAPLGDSSQQIANTAFVAANYLTPAEANQTYLTIVNAQNTYAPLVSPVLQGYPQAPTAPPGTDTNQLATTAFVIANAGGGGVGPMPPQTLLGNGTGAVANPTALTAAQTKALLAITAADVGPGSFPSGNYSITGGLMVSGLASLGANSTGVTPTAGDSSTRLATTAFVATNFLTTAAAASTYLTTTAAASTYMTIANGLTSAAAAATYLTISNAAATYAPLASPALTGAPTAVTPNLGDSSTRLATTAFVMSNGANAPIPPGTILGNNTAATATAAGLTPAQAKAVLGITAGDVGPGTFQGAYTFNSGLTVAGAAILGGGSTGVTPSVGNNSTQLATTAFVLSNGTNAPIAPGTILGNNTGASATASALTAVQAKALLAIAAPDVAPGVFPAGAYTFSGSLTVSGAFTASAAANLTGPVTVTGTTTFNGAATANAGLTASSLTGSSPTAVLDSFVIDCGTF